jgi:hypothetical protein
LEIKPLAELQEPDEMTLRFGPMGLETGRMLVAKGAALYRQEVIGGAGLVPAVAASTRGTFERLRSTYAYGILSYEIFTVVHDLVQLVIEQALRDRFMEFHQGVVCFQDATGTVHEVRERTFDELHDVLHSQNRLRRPQSWRLPLLRTGELIYFDGMLDSLFRWARGEGLFDALFETTVYPAELLCGPGSWSDALAWLSQHTDEPDEVEVLDRLFAIQHHQDRLSWPRSLDVTAGLGKDSRHGTWQLIRADYPDDAFAHASAVVLGHCSPGTGPCKRCAAESVSTGSWQEVIDFATRTGAAITPRQPPDFKVPTLRAGPRSLDIQAQG